MNTEIHINIDSAWNSVDLPMPSCDFREWGPPLRYCAPRVVVEAFYRTVEPIPAEYVLLGSGDFHYLSGLWLRRVRQTVTLVCFDNHPDWDIRPPRWSCGGWINRALELPQVRCVSVWGCGNFELAFPSRLFANTPAIQCGKLEVHGWAERQKPRTQKQFNCMNRNNWRERFERFSHSLAGQAVYVSIDLDCLCEGEAITNWENGLFTLDDLTWALRELRRAAQVVGGDLCGAYSPPVYARSTQRFAGNWDHPKLRPVNKTDAQRINRAALDRLWPVLTA